MHYNDNIDNLKHPKEGSIGAIYNWHDKPVWEHYQIVDGKAKKISEDKWHDLRLTGQPVNQPLYVED